MNNKYKCKKCKNNTKYIGAIGFGYNGKIELYECKNKHTTEIFIEQDGCKVNYVFSKFI